MDFGGILCLTREARKRGERLDKGDEMARIPMDGLRLYYILSMHKGHESKRDIAKDRWGHKWPPESRP